MDDLVVRLRRYSVPPQGWVIMGEAADEIEELRALLFKAKPLLFAYSDYTEDFRIDKMCKELLARIDAKVPHE